MKIFRNIAVAFALSAALAQPAAAQLKISASVDSTFVEMGSRATITLNVIDSSHAGEVIDLPESGAEADAFDFIDVKCDTTPAGYKYNMLIQAWYPGVLTFSPFRYAVGEDTVESEILTLKVMPVPIDSTKTLNPMESVANPPRAWYDYIPEWMPWALMGLLLAVLIALGVYLYIVYRKTGTIIMHKPKPIDPYAEAMAALGRLRASRMAESGKEKEYYTTLIDILRRYLDLRFGINAMEMSSTQILASLRHNNETRGDQPRIKQILDLADIVKFAKVRPMPDDNIKSFNTVEQFVESTKPVPVEPEADPTVSTQKKK